MNARSKANRLLPALFLTTSSIVFMATSATRDQELVTSVTDEADWPDDRVVWERTVTIEYVPEKVLIDLKDRPLSVGIVLSTTPENKETETDPSDQQDPPVEVVQGGAGLADNDTSATNNIARVSQASALSVIRWNGDYSDIRNDGCVVQKPCTATALLRTKPYARRADRHLSVTGVFGLPTTSREAVSAKTNATLGPWVRAEISAPPLKTLSFETSSDSHVFAGAASSTLTTWAQAIDVTYVPLQVPTQKQNRWLRAALLDFVVSIRGSDNTEPLVPSEVNPVEIRLRHELYSPVDGQTITVDDVAPSPVGLTPPASSVFPIELDESTLSELATVQECRLGIPCTIAFILEVSAADKATLEGLSVTTQMTGQFVLEALESEGVSAQVETTFGEWREKAPESARENAP